MASQPRTPGQHRTIVANGLTLAVTEYPAPGRPPLLLLHGIGSRSVSWWPVVDGLAAHLHLYALDLRGHGASTKPASGYRLADYAADLGAALDALGLAQPRVLGHSLGALVVLAWAIDNPERAAAIVLEDPPLRAGSETLEAFDGWMALAAMPVAQVAAYYRSEHPDWTEQDCRRRAESITMTAPAVFAELRAETEVMLEAADDRVAALAAIRSPTLLVHGDREAGSRLAPEDLARLAAILPNARFARVPGAGHHIHRDAPDRFVAAVSSFLTSAEDRVPSAE